jgi:hypothetical protein
MIGGVRRDSWQSTKRARHSVKVQKEVLDHRRKTKTEDKPPKRDGEDQLYLYLGSAAENAWATR